jgi:hypothetical protein
MASAVFLPFQRGSRKRGFWALSALAASLLACAATTAPLASADTVILTKGTSPADYTGAVNVSLTDSSGLSSIDIHYSWDHYVHIEELPSKNAVAILESYTCRNLGPCSDFISDTGTGDKAGVKGQSHNPTHHNVTLKFFPKGTGRTVVDEHYEHGIISWLDLHFRDGKEAYVYMSPPGTPAGAERPGGLPHVLEWYFTFRAATNTAVYGSNKS